METRVTPGTCFMPSFWMALRAFFSLRFCLSWSVAFAASGASSSSSSSSSSPPAPAPALPAAAAAFAAAAFSAAIFAALASSRPLRSARAREGHSRRRVCLRERGG